MAGAVPLLPTHAFMEWAETSPLYARPHKSRKNPTGFFISVCLSSVYTRVSARLPPDRFSSNLVFANFMKTYWGKIQIYLKSDISIGQFTYLLLLPADINRSVHVVFIVAGRHKSVSSRTFYCCRPT